MPNPSSINMQQLENAADDAEYLQIILDKYNEVWSANLDLLSASYAKYSEFDEYDNRFYENDGTAEIKAYIASHRSDFVTV